ncbi:hypothetical protein [Ammoniphilus sp. 3BR4]|uniref:hypothetical protein n=1 Tax=Ammoniphilus sp. 3BR4 TaxID=3158265 RepID=UPI0034665538
MAYGGASVVLMLLIGFCFCCSMPTTNGGRSIHIAKISIWFVYFLNFPKSIVTGTAFCGAISLSKPVSGTIKIKTTQNRVDKVLVCNYICFVIGFK